MLACGERQEAIVKLVLRGVFAAALAVVAAPAGAGVFYQSIPDLTVTPSIPEGFCSTCSGSSAQWIGEAFTLSALETVRSVTFTVTTGAALKPAWPVPVTLDFFQNTGVVGANLFDHTFSTSSFASVIAPTPDFDIVSVNIGGTGLSLAPGDYLIFLTNPTDLFIPAYSNLGLGTGVVVDSPTLQAGDAFGSLGSERDIGVALSNSPVVPEASSWAMMTIGFAGLGFAALRRRRRSGAAIA
jgi:hypothetical protein